jgi:hypothetical protein
MAKEVQQAVTRHAQTDMANMPTASHDKPTPEAESRSTAPSTSSVLWAAWRQGLKDLQNAVLNPFPQGHVAQHEEPGSIANPTQLEVYQEKHNEATAPEVFGRETSYTEQLQQSVRGGNDRDRGMSR